MGLIGLVWYADTLANSTSLKEQVVVGVALSEQLPVVELVMSVCQTPNAGNASLRRRLREPAGGSAGGGAHGLARGAAQVQRGELEAEPGAESLIAM